jgi:hypothetical protein
MMTNGGVELKTNIIDVRNRFYELGWKNKYENVKYNFIARPVEPVGSEPIRFGPDGLYLRVGVNHNMVLYNSASVYPRNV